MRRRVRLPRASLSLGIPAVTATAGAGHWKDEWSAWFTGRQVAIALDVGTLPQAHERAGQLAAAGARPWIADLTRVGLADKEDVTDLIVRERWSADELRKFLNDERTRTRR